MPPARKPLRIDLELSIKEDIEGIAHRTGRSIAFVVRRALAAAPQAPAGPPARERGPLVVATDDDDPADILTKIKGAAGARPLEEAIEAAFTATRARFFAWAEREQAAEAATRADDLDAGLADAAAPGTAAARLAELAKSPYPRVRSRVAEHPTTAPAVLEALAADRERTVRAAVVANPHTPPAARELAKQRD